MGPAERKPPQPPMSLFRVQGFSGYALTNWLTRRQTSGTITVTPEMSPCLKDVGPFQGQTLPSTVTVAVPSEISTAMALQIVLKPYGPGRSLRDVASIATLEQRHRQPKVSGSAMCWKSCGTSCSARLKAWASRQIRVRVLCVLSAARELWHVQVVLVVRSGRSLLACSVFSTRVRTNSEASLSSGCRLQCTAGSSGTRRRTESIRPSRRKERSSHSNVRLPRSLIGERVVTTTETKTPHHNKYESTSKCKRKANLFPASAKVWIKAYMSAAQKLMPSHTVRDHWNTSRLLHWSPSLCGSGTA